MPTLVIHAPLSQVKRAGKKSFERTLKTGIGQGYAIARSLREHCKSNCRVVLLSKDEKKRAEGRLLRLVLTKKVGSGIQRYNVHTKAMKRVTYKPERLNRNGVAVL